MRRDSRRDRDNAWARRRPQHRADGPGGRSGSEHDPVRAATVSYVDDLPQSESARRGRLPRHRRRAAAGPDGDRPRPGACAGHARGRCRCRPDPARCLPLLRVSRRRAKRSRRADERSSSRQSPRDASATSSGSIGPSTPWSRRRSWRRAPSSCRSTRCSSSFASSALVDKTGGPRERAAFTLLHRHVRDAAARQGLDPSPSGSPS